MVRNRRRLYNSTYADTDPHQMYFTPDDAPDHRGYLAFVLKLSTCLVVITSLLITVVSGFVITVWTGFPIWNLWPMLFIIPVISWIALIGIPLTNRAVVSAISVMNALTTTVESRAEIIAAISRRQLLEIEGPDDEVDDFRLIPIVKGPSTTFVDREPKPEPAKHVQFITLPNGTKIEEYKLHQFLIDSIDQGIGCGREMWVDTRRMGRSQYEGVVKLLVQAGILDNRRAGYSGDIGVGTALEAASILRLDEGLFLKAQADSG